MTDYIKDMDRQQLKKFFELKYAYLGILEKCTVADKVFNTVQTHSNGGVRTESSTPIHFIHLAEKMASGKDMSVLETSLKNLYDEYPKINELNKQETKVLKTNKHFYHNWLNELPTDKRAFLGNVVEADNYYLVEQGTDIIGGFATNANGYLTGLFSLFKGNGKEILKLRLEQGEKDVGSDTIMFQTLLYWKQTEKVLF